MSEEKKGHESTKIQKALGSHAKKLMKTVDNVKGGFVGKDVDETAEDLDYDQILRDLAAAERKRITILAIGAAVIVLVLAIAIASGVLAIMQARPNSITEQLIGTTWIREGDVNNSTRIYEKDALVFEKDNRVLAKNLTVSAYGKETWSDTNEGDFKVRIEGNGEVLVETSFNETSSINKKTYVLKVTYRVQVDGDDRIIRLVGPVNVTTSDGTVFDDYNASKQSVSWKKTATAFGNLSNKDFQQSGSNSSTDNQSASGKTASGKEA